MKKTMFDYMNEDKKDELTASPVERGVIKPCPFCGGEWSVKKETETYFTAKHFCASEGYYIEMQTWTDSLKEITKVLNKRAL